MIHHELIHTPHTITSFNYVPPPSASTWENLDLTKELQDILALDMKRLK